VVSFHAIPPWHFAGRLHRNKLNFSGLVARRPNFGHDFRAFFLGENVGHNLNLAANNEIGTLNPEIRKAVLLVKIN